MRAETEPADEVCVTGVFELAAEAADAAGHGRGRGSGTRGLSVDIDVDLPSDQGRGGGTRCDIVRLEGRGSAAANRGEDDGLVADGEDGVAAACS